MNFKPLLALWLFSASVWPAPIESIEFTTSGYIEVYAPSGEMISRHRSVDEARESAINHALQAGYAAGDYEYRFDAPESRLSIEIGEAPIVVDPVEPDPIDPPVDPDPVDPDPIDPIDPGSVPFDLTRFSIPFDYAWPAAPNSGGVTTVASAGEFNTAASQPGANIVIGANLTGNLQIRADDVSVRMPNNLTVSGSLSMDGVSRVSWTGGNFDFNGGVTQWRNVRDVLLRDVVMRGAVLFYADARQVQRVAFVDVTLDSRGNGSTQFTIYSQQGGNGFDQLIFANVKSDNSVNSAFRLQQATRTVVVESAFQMRAGNPDHTAFRFSVGSRQAFVSGSPEKPMYWCGRAHMSYLDSASYAIQDAVFDHIIQYRPAGIMATHAGSNSGVVRNHTMYASQFNVGQPISLQSFTDGGGNNAVRQWDGSLPDVSNYGAAR